MSSLGALPDCTVPFRSCNVTSSSPNADLRQCSFVTRESDAAATVSRCCGGTASCSLRVGPVVVRGLCAPFLGRRGRRTNGRLSSAMTNGSCLTVESAEYIGLRATQVAPDAATLDTSCLSSSYVFQGQRVGALFQTPGFGTHLGGTACRPAASLKEDDRESSSRAPVFPGTATSVKFNRIESTLPLSATASSFKASVRVLYSLATHGGLIAFSSLICQLAGANIIDTVHLDPVDAALGSALSLPPIAIAAFLYWDPVVDAWEVARGVRDAEDEELLEYYLGMTPLQYASVAVASAVSQEVFFRAALQGGLALALHLGGTASLEGVLSSLGAPSMGMAAVSGYFPAFAPFSQLHAAVVMAAMTGSFDYATSLRSVPNVIVTDGRNLRTLKTTFGEWYQRQQLKSIYAPMFTALLALYFGLEWIFVGNLLAPMLSHSLFLMWSMHTGLKRLEKPRTD